MWGWSAFTALTLAGASLFFIPVFIIRPFRYESPRSLLVAMALHQHATWGTLIAAALCFVIALAMWNGVNKWRKALLVAGLIVVSFFAIMARMNHFEWMFHPIASPGFEAEAKSKLDTAEMIMAVRLGTDARAYPISEMGYHHIVNDVVNGVPIAVTY